MPVEDRYAAARERERQFQADLKYSRECGQLMGKGMAVVLGMGVLAATALALFR